MSLTPWQDSSTKSLRSSTVSKGQSSIVNEQREMEDQGLGRRFLETLQLKKDKILQVDAVSGVTETNGSARTRSIQVAMEMQARGVRENDIVVICARRSNDQTVAFLASLLIGAIVAPLDLEVEFNNFVLALKPKLAFCDMRTSSQLEVILREANELSKCIVVVFGEHSDRLCFDKFQLRKADPNYIGVYVRDPKHKIAFVVASQSTSGCPKLVSISHQAVRIQVSIYANGILKDYEKVLSFFPLSWITQTILTCCCFEFPIINIIPSTFLEKSACKLIHDLRIDLIILGSDFATRVANHPSFQDYDLSNIKTVYVGGSLTTATQMTLLRSAYKPAKVMQCFGMTEMSCLVTAFTIEDYDKALEKPGSVGKLLPNIKFKILDPQTKEVLGPDWWGEIYLSGATQMLGYVVRERSLDVFRNNPASNSYFKDVQATKSALEKGYFKTGDIAQYDPDGYIYIHGRASEHLIVQGRRFYPTDVEQIIYMHPSVSEVVVLADKESVIACVIRKPGTHLEPDELLEYLLDKVPEYKRPTKIKFVESFPKTSAGKVKRNSLKHAVTGITIIHSKSVVDVEDKM